MHNFSLSTKRKKAQIDKDKCIGCTICAKKCPVNAITGKLKEPHQVNDEICIGCGICEEKCPKDAIQLVRPDNKPSTAAS